jgi:all-trans-retinol 13,14-reductase
VVLRELSPPLTTALFTAHPAGESYGAPFFPGSLRQRWRSARTPVRGLYLAGADALFLGVVGAGMGGVAAALGAAGPGLMLRMAREARRIAQAGGAAATGAGAAGAGRAAA